MRLRCFKLRRRGLKNPTLTKRQGGLLFILTVDKSRRSLGYHQFRRNWISSTQSVASHQAAGNTAFGWWYTPMAMICTLKRDDMPSLSAWIKKNELLVDKSSFFLVGVTGSKLFICFQKILYLSHFSAFWLSEFFILVQFWCNKYYSNKFSLQYAENLSIALLCIFAKTSVYVLIVTDISLCPAHRIITSAGISASTSLVMYEWRNKCCPPEICNPALLHSLWK